MFLRRDSNLAELDFQVLQDDIAQKKSKRKTSYRKYSAEDRFKIGKYASENGANAAVRKFKNSYPDKKESTVQGFKLNYEEELKKAKRQSRPMTKALPEKKRASIDAWGHCSNGSRLPQGIISFHYLFS